LHSRFSPKWAQKIFFEIKRLLRIRRNFFGEKLLRHSAHTVNLQKKFSRGNFFCQKRCFRGNYVLLIREMTIRQRGCGGDRPSTLGQRWAN
jgi:hypothetical protein